MKTIREVFKRWPALAALAAVLIICGCEGSETGEKVNDTVEELAGKKKLDQMERMKQNIAESRQKEDERQRQLEAGAGGRADE